MELTNKQIDELLTIAKTAAKTAGEYILNQASASIKVINKAGQDSLSAQVVTAIDIKSQAILLEQLSPTLEKYSLGLLSEEAEDDNTRLVQPYFWAIDPLDGTLSFINGEDGYSVSIALVAQNGNPVFGVVYQPIGDRCYAVRRGEALLLNDLPILVNDDKRVLKWYVDRSFLGHEKFQTIQKEMDALAKEQGYQSLELVTTQGAVLNAVRLLEFEHAVYFKLPKVAKGGGCIWDYAASTAMLESVGIPAIDQKGKPLQLNSPSTLYFNHCGICFTRLEWLKSYIIAL